MKINLILISTIVASNLLYASEDYVVGQFIPEKSVVIRSEVVGTVDSYNYDNGDPVKKGQELLLLSPKDYALSLDLARNELDVQRSELDVQLKQLKRYQSLLKKKGVSVSDVDNQVRVTNVSRAQFNVSHTHYKIAERTLDKASPDAPFNGVIINRSVELGQFISVGDALFTIADMERLKVRFRLLEIDFNRFTKGEKVKVEVPSVGQTIDGTITLLSPAFQNSEPGFLVEVTVDNANGKLNPGMESYVYFNDQEAM
ncbi:efflux RND transporter periplasmic adaptor subunit [Vibrio alginolyticus]|uniref:efflux RND transporter periplasmic adaptor subunit n=1 Tax=Vibrio alginolyticus TaxID=663 RepID=UPI001D2CA862|nr:efflux RND transporter periplasmic adaptor subunit [Vibrio alginolyticus]EHI5143654.1 efflux RND transporter periplasmic adaptor subunit [Vibrio alginolyticus]ELB2869946.1 efflux RND transporter periplasmic adaptor subunit [Vibrio alginolyticus]